VVENLPIYPRGFPGLRIVAGGAIAAEHTLVDLRLGMAVHTGARDGRTGFVHVAVNTGCLGVLSYQWKPGRGVVEPVEGKLSWIEISTAMFRMACVAPGGGRQPGVEPGS
jgi:hypothetical protein